MQISTDDLFLDPIDLQFLLPSGITKSRRVEGHSARGGNGIDWLKNLVEDGAKFGLLKDWTRSGETLLDVEIAAVRPTGPWTERRPVPARDIRDAALKRILGLALEAAGPHASTEDLLEEIDTAVATWSIFVSRHDISDEDTQRIAKDLLKVAANDVDRKVVGSLVDQLTRGRSHAVEALPEVVLAPSEEFTVSFRDPSDGSAEDSFEPDGVVSPVEGTTIVEWLERAAESAGIDFGGEWRVSEMSARRHENRLQTYGFRVYAVNAQDELVQADFDIRASSDRQALIQLAKLVVDETMPREDCDIQLSEYASRMETALSYVHVETRTEMIESDAHNLLSRLRMKDTDETSPKMRAFMRRMRDHFEAGFGITRRPLKCGTFRSGSSWSSGLDSKVDLEKTRVAFGRPDLSPSPRLPGF